MLRIRDEGLEFSLFGWPPVLVHWSMPAVTLLLTAGLWLPFRARPLAVATVVIPGIMLSILAHELGHALVARRLGLSVTAIRLHAGGGEALIAGWAWSRRVDTLITAAGPAVNVVLGVLCLAAYWMLWDVLHLNMDMSRPTGLRSLLRPFWATALWWLGVFNLVLAGVNLLPAFPLDGGRLARNVLEPRIGVIKAQHRIGLAGIILAVVSGFVFFVSLLASVPIFAPPYLRPNLEAYEAARAGRQLPDE